MTSLLMKIIICPLVVALSASFLANVHYANFIQPIIVGLILAVAGVAMEYLFLKEGRVWFSTLMDFVASVIIVYFVTNLFTTASATLFGALIIGFLLAVTEHFTHSYLVKSGKTRKTSMA
ncbi:DUF2512 family protein [Bacillus luteolus]|uniref:DUF2512 family protein n=1 Tax=Litchfieldia luteola TaxID=682179 RepID=A0ABR9QNP8_9BACI|nr:DUF2512 family protein [Cytobacillus luteolus]MBE4910117.1 DUF2512 family protein [Cytobacillus luteolus]MBP1942319.1 uncharacterized membrane protein HdeD (DUF308 family) [Cytobacillus luteolus]